MVLPKLNPDALTPAAEGAYRCHARAESSCRAGVHGSQRSSLGQAQAERPMTVFVYVNTSKQVGDVDHVKVFATTDAAET